MEIRPINANDLEQFAYCTEPATWYNPYGGDCVVKMEDIEKLPTLDWAPIKHGRWVSLTECANAGVYCSVCNKKVYKEDYAWCNRKNKLRSPYCPHCGAKMDLEVTNGLDEH